MVCHLGNYQKINFLVFTEQSRMVHLMTLSHLVNKQGLPFY